MHVTKTDDSMPAGAASDAPYPDAIPPPYSVQVPQDPTSPLRPQEIIPPQQPSGVYYQQNPRVIYVNETNAPVAYTIQRNTVFLPCRGPVRMYCPYEGQEVVTQVSRQVGLLALFSSAFLCFVCWPCFCLPCCCNSCLDQVHKCPSCKNVLAVIPA
ncbi:hypothetical protein SeMB42_g04002 [Synchytrium endobioticum]|uniref:LITAF domain-containing protein n=1 Tax=Synchytrium endobioticum TaxID=286115 RepID=A0A507D1V3_9FUNG|nr:hypothetical protein SeMB42_g04002 [Synchytrium endobioticum]